MQGERGEIKRIEVARNEREIKEEIKGEGKEARQKVLSRGKKGGSRETTGGGYLRS